MGTEQVNVKGIGKIVPVHTIKSFGGMEVLGPLILSLGTTWDDRTVQVPVALLSREKRPQYPLNRRLGVPHSWSA